MKKCPYCGEKYSEVDVCPKCSLKLEPVNDLEQSQTEEKQEIERKRESEDNEDIDKMKKCPNCEKIYPIKKLVCDECGRGLLIYRGDEENDLDRQRVRKDHSREAWNSEKEKNQNLLSNPYLVLKCQSCDEINLPGSKFCRSCGKKLKDAGFTYGYQYNIICSNCRSENPVNSRYCSKCGSKLSLERCNMTAGKKCTNCGWRGLIRAKYCINCGKELIEGTIILLTECDNCNSFNIPSSTYCRTCGDKIKPEEEKLENHEESKEDKSIKVEKLKKGETLKGGKGKKITVKSKIDSGGFGVVYEGKVDSGQRCVIKQVNVWNPGIPSDITKKKLKVERKILDRIGDQPYFPELIDYDEQFSPPYIVINYIEGETLKEKLKTSKSDYQPLSEDEARKYIIGLLDAVEFLHNFDQPLIHRNIRPLDVMVSSDEIKLIDFGTAVAEWDGLDTTGKTRVLTPGYGAPEQAKAGEKVDIRSDIYGVGTTLFFLLTGKNLQGKKNECFNSNDRLKKPSEFNPSVSKEMDKIVQKATELNREDRYQSAKEMKKELKNFLEKKKIK